jgi:manganese/zinc/iron transport system substrate-binding protein
MGPGVDPHLYRATLGDTKKLKGADAIFYSGLHLEGRLADVLESMARNKQVFELAEVLTEKSSDRLRKPEQFQGYYDPHVWFDVAMWAECADYAGECMAKLDPAHETEYKDRTLRYTIELKELDTWCRERLSEIPKERRVLVTAHDAFGYLGLAYDVEVHGLQGISTADEADLSSITALVDLMVNRKIKAVFVESSVPPKNIKSLIEGCAARGHKVVEGGELYSDAMGLAGTPEGTYVGMVRYNINTIVNALK